MSSNNAPKRTMDQPAEPPDPMSFVDDACADEAHGAESGETYPEHPLFPREGDEPETRDIHFVTFRRRRSDGKVDNCPEDVRGTEINSWADVVGPWGGGEYKAIGKDKNHKIVAWYPPKREPGCSSISLRGPSPFGTGPSTTGGATRRRPLRRKRRPRP